MDTIETLAHMGVGFGGALALGKWARSFLPDSAEPVLVFIDPPYADYQDHPERVTRLLEGLSKTLPAGWIIASESSRKLAAEVLPDVDAWDIRRYGGTQVAIRTIGTVEGSGGSAVVEGPTDVEA